MTFRSLAVFDILLRRKIASTVTLGWLVANLTMTHTIDWNAMSTIRVHGRLVQTSPGV